MQRIKSLVGAVLFPLIGYRPQRVSAETWDREYRDGKWGYLGAMENMAGLTSILGYCEYLNPQSILDVGCGEGLLAKKLKLLPYATYLGLDVSREAIALASKLTDARTRFAVGEAHDFRPEHGFDMIIFNQSLYYLPDPAAIMAQYRAFLNPGGRIIVSMVDSPRTRPAWPLVEKVMRVEDAMTITQGRGRVITKVLAPS